MPSEEQSQQEQSSKTDTKHRTTKQPRDTMNHKPEKIGSALRASFQRAENPTRHRSKHRSRDNGFRSAKSKRTTPPEPFHTECLRLRSDTQREKDSGSRRYSSTLGSLIAHAPSSCDSSAQHCVPAARTSSQSVALASSFRFPVGGAPDQRAIARGEKTGKPPGTSTLGILFFDGLHCSQVAHCCAGWSSGCLGGDRRCILGPLEDWIQTQRPDGWESRGCRLVLVLFADECAAVSEFGLIAFVIHPPPTLSHVPPVSLSLTGPLAKLVRHMLPAREIRPTSEQNQTTGGPRRAVPHVRGAVNLRLDNNGTGAQSRPRDCLAAALTAPLSCREGRYHFPPKLIPEAGNSSNEKRNQNKKQKQ